MKRYILGLLAATAALAHAQVTNLTNAAAGTNAVADAAATATRTTAASGKTGDYWGLVLWIVVLGGIFAFLWAKGYLVKIRNYVDETREELRKCSWPSREELKGSTVVIMVTIAILGAYTVGVDWILSNLMRLIT